MSKEVNPASGCTGPSSCWARPATRGELRDTLCDGVACEVVAYASEITAIMLRAPRAFGFLGFDAFTVRPSDNAGWMIFEPNVDLNLFRKFIDFLK